MTAMTTRKDNRPLTFKVASIYAFVFSAMFLIYGGINVILSVLDRNYVDLNKPIIYGLVGLLLITVAYAFKELKAWGWYALVGIYGAVAVLALIGLSNVYNVIILIITGIALASLLAPQTTQYVFKRR